MCLILEPHTFNSPSLKIETPLIAVLAIASLGQLLVVMVGGFDLSVAAVMTFASALLLKVSEGSNDRLALALLATLAACMAIGVVNGVLTSFGLNPLIVTLAMGGVVAAITLLISNGGVEVISFNIPTRLSDFASGYAGNVSKLFFVAIALVLLLAVILHSTRIGRRLISTGT